MSELQGQRVTVMGLGRFGGGAGVTRWLVKQGAHVTLTDLAREEELRDSLAQLEDLRDRLTLRLGGHDAADFEDADLIVANPGVKRPWEDPFLKRARERGVAVTTEIELLVDRLPARERVIGITGTAGKSTTSAMIHAGLTGAGVSCHFGGNIGGSLLGTTIDAGDWVVLELSSAQLHWLNGWSPGIAVVTNFASNHVDWHGSADHYRASKQSMLAHQRAGDRALLGPGAEDWALAEGVATIPLLDAPAGVRTPGRHNARNAGAARSVCASAFGEDSPELCQAIAAFRGLPHRLQLVCELGGVAFYDDSKCTTPEGCAIAIEALGDRRIHLIAGGYDKGVPLGERFGAATRRVHALYAIGEMAGAVVKESRASRTVTCGTLEHAVKEIAVRASAGDAVLLSPACASWDQFTNFVERGNRFVELVREQFGALV